MTALPKLSIKKGREWQLLRGHPWLFSGAISQAPNKLNPGDLVDLVDISGEFIARGYYNAASDIAVRVLTLNPSEEVDRNFLRLRLRDAMELRRLALNQDKTNVYRLINAEGDRLPGLIVDRLSDVMVVQSHTAGADRLLPDLIELLVEEAQPRAMILRNDAMVRKREGLEQEPPRVVHGDPAADFTNIEVRENGLVFTVDLVTGQKTGFFADQREKRCAVREFCERLPPNSTVANIFSYSAAFSIYALKGNPHLHTVNVDESSKALELAHKNFAGNGIELTNQSFVQADAFKWLDEQLESARTFQFVILDPPAFAKSHKDKEKAMKAYTRLNKLGLSCCAPGAFLLTCSCSGAVNLEEFQACVRSAAGEANRSVQILQVFKNSADHPVNVAAPETEYLKALLCRVLVILVFAISLLTAPLARADDRNRSSGAKSDSNYNQAVSLVQSADDLLNKGKTDESIKLMIEAERLAPGAAGIEDRFAYVLSHAGKSTEALEHEKKAVALAPNDPEIWRNLGLTYHDLGDETNAAKALQKFVYLAPSHPEAERARKFIERYQAMAEIAKDDNAYHYYNAATREHLYWWQKKGKPIKVSISSVDCPDPRLLEIVQKAFDDWSKASSQIYFEFVKDPKNADMQVLWTSDVKKIFDQNEGGEARCEYTDDRIDSARITFLTTRMIMHGQLMPEKARWFALHEIGHALGLLGHSPNHEDVMYWACPSSFTEVNLSPRDKETLKMLYTSATGEKH